MEVLETISGERNNLLPDTTHGKEEVVIEKLIIDPDAPLSFSGTL